MSYRLNYSEEALSGLAKLYRSDPKAYSKSERILAELQTSPKQGIGRPEPLKGKPENRWSRAISKKHRLVYRIDETEKTIHILTAYGHYGDK